MKDNGLDKFIKSKLDERSFEYDPKDWENALKLIEKEDKRERPLWIWWAAASIVALGLLYFGWSITNNETKGALSESVISEQKKELDQENGTFKAQENEIENLSSDDAIQSKSKELKNQESENSPKTRITTGENGLQQEVVPRITAQVIDITNLPDPISGNHPKSEPKSSPEPELTTEGRPGEEFLVLDSEDQKVKQRLAEKEVQAAEKSIMFDSEFESIPSRLDLIKYFSPAKLPRVEPTSDPEIKLGFGWGINAFANPYVGDVQDGKKITGFSVGALASYRFSKILSLNADLQYSYRTGTFEKSNANTRRRFKFDAQEVAATLNPTALHYASIPIYAGLHFSRHRVVLGGSLNYLAAVRGGLNDKVIDGTGNVIDEIDLEGWIARDGFTTLNPGALIGYDYSLSNRWSINFRSNYLFNSIIDEQKSLELNSPILKEHSQLNLQIGTTFYFK